MCSIYLGIPKVMFPSYCHSLKVGLGRSNLSRCCGTHPNLWTLCWGASKELANTQVEFRGSRTEGDVGVSSNSAGSNRCLGWLWFVGNWLPERTNVDP